MLYKDFKEYFTARLIHKLYKKGLIFQHKKGYKTKLTFIKKKEKKISFEQQNVQIFRFFLLTAGLVIAIFITTKKTFLTDSVYA